MATTRETFIVRALSASGTASIWALGFALIFGPVLFVLILGLVPVVEIAFLPQKALGLPSGGSSLSMVVFWSMAVYLVVFVRRMSTAQQPETGRQSRAMLILPGALGILALCLGAMYLIQEHQTEVRARQTKDLVLAFVRDNETVAREAGGTGNVSLSSGAYDRDGSGRYDVSVTGARTIYAMVDASKDSPRSKLTLLCTSITDPSRRDPYKHPCKQ